MTLLMIVIAVFLVLAMIFSYDAGESSGVVGFLLALVFLLAYYFK